MSFTGFSRGTLYTPVPNPFFGPLLEQIGELAELKVTLRGLWLFHRKRGWPRTLSLDEFLADRTLLRAVGSPGKDPGAEIRRGLQLAVARGTFLLYQPESDAPERGVYLLNTDSDRSALDRLRAEGSPAREEDAPPTQDPAAAWTEKPNIFALYEENIGMLSPLLAEELKDAEQLYPRLWVEDAFEIAVTENKRSWRYIAGVLRRWAAEGKDHGKPGRHPEKDNRQKYLADYERRWGAPSRERTRR
jgi:DnaD/phage-associated family protein